MKQLSIAELVAKLNEGGWVVHGGHAVRDLHYYKGKVTQASFEGDTLIEGDILKVEIEDRTFELHFHNSTLNNPWTIVVTHQFKRQQQRKQSEGGGWHEVTATGIELQIRNPVIEDNIRREQREREQTQKEERTRQLREERAERRRQFAASLTRVFVGQKITNISITGEDLGGLCIELGDGSEIDIQLDGGDTYDAWLTVNSVSLQDFLPKDLL